MQKIQKPITYRPSNPTALRFLIGGAIAFILVELLVAGPNEFVVGFTILCLAAYVFMFRLTMIIITPDTLVFKSGGLPSRHIPIADIVEIKDDTMLFPVAQSTLGIYYRTSSGTVSKINIYPSTWENKTLGNVIAALLERNSLITLDDYARGYEDQAR